MYRNYEEYEKAFEVMVKRAAPAGINIVKKSLEEFLVDNYRDKIEWYLTQEWGTETFPEIFYRDCECDLDEDCDEISEEEMRGDDLHSGVWEIVNDGYERGMSVNQTAFAVYEYLKNEGAI